MEDYDQVVDGLQGTDPNDGAVRICRNRPLLRDRVRIEATRLDEYIDLSSRHLQQLTKDGERKEKYIR